MNSRENAAAGGVQLLGPIVFIDILKTAGTTIQSPAPEHFGAQESARTNDRSQSSRRLSEAVKTYGPRALSGHCSYSRMTTALKDAGLRSAAVFSLLGEPVVAFHDKAGQRALQSGRGPLELVKSGEYGLKSNSLEQKPDETRNLRHGN
jgi:hypothetical protein